MARLCRRDDHTGITGTVFTSSREVWYRTETGCALKSLASSTPVARTMIHKFGTQFLSLSNRQQQGTREELVDLSGLSSLKVGRHISLMIGR